MVTSDKSKRDASVENKITPLSASEKSRPVPPGLRVLAVDDDPAILRLIETTLIAAGHQVMAAGDGKAALALAFKMDAQLVITDWVMPVMDGLSLCRALRENPQGKKMYVLMLSSLKGEGNLIQALEAGVDAYAVKPFTPKGLNALVLAAQRALLT